jgi:hypothetical protein
MADPGQQYAQSQEPEFTTKVAEAPFARVPAPLTSLDVFFSTPMARGCFVGMRS